MTFEWQANILGNPFGLPLLNKFLFHVTPFNCETISKAFIRIGSNLYNKFYSFTFRLSAIFLDVVSLNIFLWISNWKHYKKFSMNFRYQPSGYSWASCSRKGFSYSRLLLYSCTMRWSGCWRGIAASSCQRCSGGWAYWTWPYVSEPKYQWIPGTWLRILPRIRSRARCFWSDRWKQTRLSFHCAFGNWIDSNFGSFRSCFLHWLEHEPSSHIWNCSRHRHLGRSLGN